VPLLHVWYPRARGATGPFPLLLFAPGFLQCPGAYSHLLRAWASAGYVVAAVTFPRTSCHLGADADGADLVNQPGDLSYVLTRLLALSMRPGGPISGLLNPDAVGAAGDYANPEARRYRFAGRGRLCPRSGSYDPWRTAASHIRLSQWCRGYTGGLECAAS
jgi:hypothetical protein